ncbi:hypothetical protein NW760_015476, partial [Fusarium oxysporum]
VKQFLLSGPKGMAGQTFTIQDANKTMASVVMTYLDYGIFDTQLSNRVIPLVQHGSVPMKVFSSVLDSSSIQKVALRLLKSQKPSSIDHILCDPEQDLATYKSLCRALDRNVLVVDVRDADGRTPLSWAAKRGHEAMVSLLLEKGAAIDSEDRFGRTPLEFAAERRHEAMVQLLESYGAQSGDDV